ncbi:uncharacterized protein LOC132278026 [Cornus florida]|uniref:uncharacterized protein LOC132278026 n=1 Tax=Cornus florida TaxID=4283 RepID=UPI0028A07E0F|nr:uncharacterized protein LOC132278026 [Cornus florida]
MRSDYSIEAWDLRDPSSPKYQVFDSPDFCPGKLYHKFKGSYNFTFTNYLVESSGDLLVLRRFIALSVAETEFVHPRRSEDDVVNNINDDERENLFLQNLFLQDDDAYWTLGFDVHNFDFGQSKWEPVDCLGDRALFVGSNHSFSLSTCHYPELMKNSIYFTDHFLEGFNQIYDGHDNGVFHLENNCIKPYYPRRLKIINPPPV